MKVNISSSDFPFNSIRKFPDRINKPKNSSLKIFKEFKNTNNREIPEYFKISQLSDNPQTFKSKHVETPYVYGSILNTKEFPIQKIKELDTLKTNPNKIKKLERITVEDFSDISFKEKRNRLETYKPKEEQFPNDYLASNIVQSINKKASKLPYKVRSSINDLDINKERNRENNTSNSNLIPQNSNDLNHYPNMVFDFHPKRSAYLKNYSDFNIKQSDPSPDTRTINFPKKKVLNFDCITDRYKEIQPADYIEQLDSNYSKK